MKQVVCTSCGYVGPARTYGCTRVGILLFLLALGILPGLLYAVYADSWVKRCPNCDQKSIIPADSPAAQKITSP
jgi:uncharacterized membrane protein YqaE (UPF0057 family)